MACEQFDAAELKQYEISNFARQGFASRHNLKYWRRLPYIGFGLDAHSMLLTDAGAVRFANTSDMDSYMDRPESVFRQVSKSVAEPDFDVIDLERAFEESLFLGLRLNEGVSLRLLRGQFGEAMVQDAMPALLEVREAGLLEFETDRSRLTARGRMVSNEVFSRLLVPSAA
jgi:oxygen-independent coproporphyrinogen-3 oxidase